MTLLSPDDPVFAIDLTVELGCGPDPRAPDEREAGAGAPEPPPPAPIRAVALLVDPAEDPILLEIPPTRDTVLLDAVARVLRVAVREGVAAATVAAGADDPVVRAFHTAGAFPRFLYEGAPAHVAARLPDRVRRALGRPGEPPATMPK